ncbi:porin [Pseudoduganella violaceinigra]|uniref:porin n=1 Tax=Pseudoduganella violaceinigra TaxID=246602 RepID=UPI0013771DF8|nr:porin [Pseudoduganella violaceinigra]
MTGPILMLAMAPACAQTPVTPFGTLDVTSESVHAGPVGRQSRVSSNSSGFGFKGSESLDGGWKAFFQIEGGISVDTGAGGVNSRDTFLGLAGPLGTLRLGFMTAPMRALGGRLNYVPGATSIANNLGVMTTLNGLHAGLNARLANSVQYTLPAPEGWTPTLLWSPGEARPQGFNDRTLGAGLNYEVGPWFAGWAYENRRAQQKLALGDSSDWETRLVLRYAFGAWGVNAGWDRLGSRGLFGAGHGAVRRDAWTAGAVWRQGQHDVMLHWSRARAVHCSGAADGKGQCAAANIGATGAHQVALLYHYALSKRSTVGLFYTRILNDGQALYDFDVNPVVPTLAQRHPGADPTGVGWGLRHSF